MHGPKTSLAGVVPPEERSACRATNGAHLIGKSATGNDRSLPPLPKFDAHRADCGCRRQPRAQMRRRCNEAPTYDKRVARVGAWLRSPVSVKHHRANGGMDGVER